MIGPLGRLGAAAALRQHCPQMTQRHGTCFDCRQVLTINVKPGWKSGTKITFQREGDQAPNKIPADIVFIIRDKPHALFKREGCDLKYTAKVSLKEVGSEFASPIKNHRLSHASFPI